ncbi:hypothetical protein BDY19DRAFT_122579 [Irpex rosettiformis]|uniref:Uncharacterized protein n=1 Tax=Irpex rosettiformis TaxID=378272 RepID=A0ACB8U3Y2_9APHY|nr:hypothetical protein BDY19DRAFT_122579 [Irpex rosettiformis]
MARLRSVRHDHNYVSSFISRSLCPIRYALFFFSCAVKSTMNLLSIINPQDLGGLQHPEIEGQPQAYPEAALSGRTTPRRSSARPRHSLAVESLDTTSSELSCRKTVAGRSNAKLNGATKRRGVSKTYPSKAAESDHKPLVASLKAVPQKRKRVSRTSSPTHPARTPRHSRSVPPIRSSATRDLVNNARAAAHTSSDRTNRPVSIMDVVLDAQVPNKRLDIEDLQDAIEECHRVALSIPASDVDELLADMFVPGRIEARQAFLAQDVEDLATEITPNEIYRISAERSTATWEPCLDSELSDDSPSISAES